MYGRNFKRMKKLAIKLIKFYQSRTKHNRKWCRYSPTCSNYALEAYQKFNFFYASLLTFYRILRCNPFSKGGYDPVPLTRREKKLKKRVPNLFEEGTNFSKEID